MKKALISFGAFLLVSSVVFSYEYIVNPAVPSLYALTSTQITTLTSGNWDDGYYDLALPAGNQFYFYGRKVTHLRISTNGYIVLGFGSASGSGTGWSNYPIPNGTDPDSIVAPWWDDWNLTTNGQIWYTISTQGPGNNNWVTIEWRGVAHLSDATSRKDFQVIFMGEYNGTDVTWRQNSIIFSYDDVDTGAALYNNGLSGTVGIEHYSGYQGEQYSYNTASLSDAQTIMFTPFVPIYDTTKDMAYTDPGQTTPDYVVFRPSNGYWYAHNYGAATTEDPIQWGTRGDVALPGDFDGDGDADELVYRPSNSTFYSWDPPLVIPWGTVNDIPMVADFNYDGTSDIAVFRPSNGYWYIRYSTGSTAAIQWGTQGDIPVPADYDGDGTADLTVYRPSNNYWYIRRSSNPGSPWAIKWGTDGDIPLPINVYTSSSSDITVFRPSSGTWYCYNVQANNVYYAIWGTDGDQPVPANFTAAASPADYMVFRPSEGNWYSHNWLTNGYGFLSWGTLGDKPRCRYTFQIVAPQPSVGADTR